MAIKEWVRAARLHAHMTQEQLGEKLGVTKGNVSGWENGRHRPSFDQVMKIEHITGLSMADRIGDESSGATIKEALSVIDAAALKLDAEALAEVQRAFELYFVNPQRYGKLLPDIEDLLMGNKPLGSQPSRLAR